jgi:hypothetical protein
MMMKMFPYKPYNFDNHELYAPGLGPAKFQYVLLI